jgi:hypothetical protein
VKTALLTVVVIVGTAAPLLLMWALSRGFRGEWERYTERERHRFLRAVAVITPIIVAGTVALILIDPAK